MVLFDVLAQNVSAEGFGAHTGEYTADMLKSCNVDGAIVGLDSDGSRRCVECEGSIAATFAVPLGFLAAMLILGFICVRAMPGRLGAVANQLNDAVFDVGKSGDLDYSASAAAAVVLLGRSPNCSGHITVNTLSNQTLNHVWSR